MRRAARASGGALPTQEMVAAAIRLLPWAKAHIAASDVATWWLDGRVPAFAFVGDALRIERTVLLPQMLPNRGSYLDLSMQRAIRLDAALGQHGGVTGGVGQTMSTPDAHISEVMDGVASALRAILGLDDSDTVHVAIMPSEGAPWNPSDARTVWFSARKRRLFETAPPPWVVEVEVRDDERGSGTIRRPGADFCAIAQRMDDACSTGHAMGVFLGGRGAISYPSHGEDFLVAHSFDLERRGRGDDDALADGIARCGGLLFPSLSIGPTPASNFGECSLIFDPGVVLAGLKSYRAARGRWPVVVYSTDTWTETTGALVSEASAILFDQLTGRWTPGIYGFQHFYVLGPPVMFDGGPMEGRVVDSTTRLRTILKRRARLWPRDLSPREVLDRQTLDEDRYPYLEAKCNGILPLSCAPVAVAPADLAGRYSAFLRRAGFRGEILPLDVPSEVLQVIRTKVDMASVFAYGWAVTDAVVAWTGGRRFEVV